MDKGISTANKSYATNNSNSVNQPAYKHSTIRNIVSRGREGLFVDDIQDPGMVGGGAPMLDVKENDEGNADTSKKPTSNIGNNRIPSSRRHVGRHRYRQIQRTTDSTSTANNMSVIDSVLSPALLPKLSANPLPLTAGTSMNFMTPSSNSNSQLGSVPTSGTLASSGVTNLRGRHGQSPASLPLHGHNVQPSNLPARTPVGPFNPNQRALGSTHSAATALQSTSNHSQSSSSSTQQNGNQSLVPSSSSSGAGGGVGGPLRDSLAIYHEDHSPHAAVTSIKGLKPGNAAWKNQDNFFVLHKIDGKELHMYCVLDGHGEHGHHVSRRARENLPQFVKSSGFDLKKSFLSMQNDLCSCEYDVRCSGATCVLALLSGKKIVIANCGDSRAVLARKNANGSISGHPLSTDHKPDNVDERKRIVASGGQVGCRHVLVQQGRGHPVSMPVGPCRVWYQNRVGETLGLAMSRSLGDAVAHKCGVSAEPELTEHSVDSNDEFLILATDGVFDVLDNQQVVQIAVNTMNNHLLAGAGAGGKSGGNSQTKPSSPNSSRRNGNGEQTSSNWPLEAANNICRFARSKWERLSPMVDDITCIVVSLKR